MTAVKHRKFALTTLFAVYTMEILMVVVVFVVFSPLLVDPTSSLLAVGTPTDTSDLILGFLLAAYPLTQFFGAPLLGEFSDRFGRRPVLLIATIGSGIFTMLTALAIIWGSLWLLLASRLASGFFGGCTTVAMACVADLSRPEVRGRYLSALVMAGGLGWIIGPYIGSLLSEISFATPFWFLGAIFFVLTAMVIASLAKEERPQQKLQFISAFQNMGEVLKDRLLLSPLLSNIINLMGWLTYQAFLAAYLIQRYDFTELWEGFAYAVSSAWWLVGGLICSQWLLRKYKPRLAAIAPFFITGLAVLSYQFFYIPAGVWFALAFANIGQAMIQGTVSTTLSLMVDDSKQGKMFGALNAGFALAALVGPLLAGWLVSYWINLPFLVGALVILAMATWYTIWALRHREAK
jgi:MFS family permease